MPTKIQVTIIKLSKFISSPKMLKANRMLISHFPNITLLLLHESYPENVLINYEETIHTANITTMYSKVVMKMFLVILGRE